MSRPYLIAAITGRALAQSAARRGHSTVVLDCFADRDTRAAATQARAVVGMRSVRLDARALLAAAAALAPPGGYAGVVYGAGFEGRPDLLARLARGGRLCGNAPETVSQVRDPARFFPLLRKLGIRHPEVRFAPPARPSGWLVKDPGGAGGAQVRHARRGRARAGCYYQRFEPAETLSAIFLANGERARVLGFNRQWSTPARPGRPFLYGGAVSGVALPPAMEADLSARLDTLVAATGLVGLNGLDFLRRGDEWLALEVNPRPTATMDLYDADYGEGLFTLHLQACEGALPEALAPRAAVRAHAVFYASTFGRVGGDVEFPAWCRDIPHPGFRFAPGVPVCTVHAEAADHDAALALLRQRLARLESALIEKGA
ncbi:MAG TPA: ATP-grasp domain-containing protein [Gemmatimonadales bacterium]|nr:ATP-grasp domain-containing protein [Gemmatimonadales bacterium]